MFNKFLLSRAKRKLRFDVCMIFTDEKENILPFKYFSNPIKYCFRLYFLNFSLKKNVINVVYILPSVFRAIDISTLSLLNVMFLFTYFFYENYSKKFFCSFGQGVLSAKGSKNFQCSSKYSINLFILTVKKY